MRAPTSVAEFLLDAVQVHIARVWNRTRVKMCAQKCTRVNEPNRSQLRF